MRDHEYKIGETVFIEDHHGRPTHRSTVKEIKSYKRGPKVTLEDGTEWDPEAGGRRWGSRSENWYTGPRLQPHSDSLEAKYRVIVGKSYVKWVFQNFEELSTEQQEALVQAAAAAKKCTNSA